MYASLGTFKAKGLGGHYAKVIQAGKKYRIHNFTVIPFVIEHDAAEPLGFLIHHPDTGNILFVTDTASLNYKFDNLAHLIVECNYDEDIINEKVWDGRVGNFLKDRIIDSHLELETLKHFLRMNNLMNVVNIVLCHLSDSNSHELRFKKEVVELTGKQVFAADKGLEVNLSSAPF